MTYALLPEPDRAACEAFIRCARRAPRAARHHPYPHPSRCRNCYIKPIQETLTYALLTFLRRARRAPRATTPSLVAA